MKPFITHFFFVRRVLWGLIVVLCIPLWSSLVAGQQGSITGPPLLTYNDLVALYGNDVPSEELHNRLMRLLTTPFVNNSARTRAGSSPPPGENFLRIAMWNIERGLEFDAVKAALTNDQRFFRRLAPERRPTKLDLLGLAQDRTLKLEKTDQAASRFRVERLTIVNGGELLTIWGRVIDGSETASSIGSSQAGEPVQTEEIPLMSVLRDTFGDAVEENDVLREVWVHTYVRPRLAQRAAALVPFLYKGLRVEPQASLTTAPPAIINLSDTGQRVWRQLLVSAVTNVLIDHPLLKTSVHNYQRNISDYRMSNLMRALTILSLYGSQLQSDSPFSEAELVQMQSQLALTEKTFGGLVDRIHFPSIHEKQTAALRDTRGHNWELLRQQAEASGLYFEPLSLSDKNQLPLHAHMLRHTHATELIRANWDVSYVQKRLGHAHVHSTMIYVHLDNEDMAKKWQHFQEQRRDYSIDSGGVGVSGETDKGAVAILDLPAR